MREWFTVAEAHAAGGAALPGTVRSIKRMIDREGWCADPRFARLRAGRGGGWEFHLSRWPADVQARLIARQLPAPANGEARSSALWARFEGLSEAQKDEAKRRLGIVDRAELLGQGMAMRAAVALASKEAGVSSSTLWTWLRAAGAAARADRLAALAPRHAGRTATAECHPNAWQYLVADYLRPAAPAFDACYRRMCETAAAQGWSPVPSEKTLRRRLEREVPKSVRVLKRASAEAAKRMYPHQVRDRAVFHAMQAVNADGHRFDVFVKWADGKITRPHLIAVQDLYSGMIVGHRVDRSENWGAVRLAFADAIESFGIPEQVYFDNGRAFASKMITGGAPTRFRFKVREDEPEGVLKLLGVQVHWTTPYHGQAKPIERAFRDLAEEISKHPFCEGAYTGNKPDAKPENYGAKAIPIDAFTAFVAQQIVRHNMRQGRRSAVAQGRSFADAFRASYQSPSAIIKKAAPAQLRMLLLAAEGVPCRKPDGSVYLGENRYWSEALVGHAGRKVIVRFDPQNLFLPVAVYALDGGLICEAECIERTGFNDVSAARAYAQKRNAWLKLQREQAALVVEMSIDDLVRLNPPPEPLQPLPEPKVVRLVANASFARAEPEPEPDDVASPGAESLGRAARALERGLLLPFQKEGGGP